MTNKSNFLMLVHTFECYELNRVDIEELLKNLNGEELVLKKTENSG